MAGKPSTEDRLSEASHALVDALVDRTIGAVDRKVGALTDRMETLAQNGGLPLPPGDHHPVQAVGGAVSGAVSGAVGTAKDKLANAKLPHPSLPSVSLPNVSLPHPSLPHPHLPRPHLGRGGSDEGGDEGDQASSKDSSEDTSEDSGHKSGQNGSETKVTTIIEEIDVGVPVSLVYDQWTEFGSFPSFMKKVENVDAVEDQRLKWKAQIWWSHREWEATILEQIPEERIVWRSEGSKGHVDGVVTFHELTPDLTRVIVVLEYFPQGLFERTANLWRAQGRRVRAELQHFRRHVMAHAVLEPDQVQGWHGVIEEGEVVESDEDYDEGADEDTDEGEEQPEDEPEDEYEEPEDESGEDEEPEEDQPEDEYDEEPEDELEEDEEPEDDEQEERA